MACLIYIIYLQIPFEVKDIVGKNKKVPYSVEIAKFLTYTQGTADLLYLSGLSVYVYIGVWRYLTESGQQPTFFIYNNFLFGCIREQNLCKP